METTFAPDRFAAMDREQEVGVLGGANSAGEAALFFARCVRKVTMLVRAADLGASMSQYLVDRIRTTANIEVMTRVEVMAVCGPGHLERVAVRRLDTYSSASAVSNSRRAFAATNFIWDHAIETSQSIFVV